MRIICNTLGRQLGHELGRLYIYMVVVDDMFADWASWLTVGQLKQDSLLLGFVDFYQFF